VNDDELRIILELVCFP